jgi:hypothetical protein
MGEIHGLVNLMVLGLVPPEEEKRIFEKLLEYYRKLYPEVKFSMKEELLDHKKIGNLYYTYPGEETEATAEEKMRMISSAVGESYATPIIVLAKKRKLILLDGHRRARVAFREGMNWHALVIVPSKDVKFGIEKMIMGKLKDLYSSRGS